MKRFIIPIILLIIVSLGGFIAFRAISLSQTNSQLQAQVLTANNLRHVTLTIDGMWCSSCTAAAEYALKEKSGVINASVRFKENLEGIGEVIYNPKQINLEEIIKAVEPYKATVEKDEQATSADPVDFK